jgi:[ribosomal protein S5]-alanine N-acetyltransferase
MQITGKRVVLRPMMEEDAPRILRWWNDGEVMYYADDNPHPRTSLKELAEQFRRETVSWAGYMRRFLIETTEGRPIGTILYRGYRSDTRSASMGIVIGEKTLWGRGYGTESIAVLLRHLFEDMRLHKVAITVSDFNARAIRAYEKCGFRRDGTLRHNAVIGGKYVDHYVMSILDSEYFQARAADGDGQSATAAHFDTEDMT